MQNLIAWAQSNTWVRLALSILGGLAAAVALYAWNKHLDKRHRREIATVGGISTGIIIWLLLGAIGTSPGTATLPDINIGGSTVPAVNLGSLGSPTYDIDFEIPAYDPSVIFQNPTPPQAMSLCGCAERADAWGQYLMQLWNTLDEVFPQGPSSIGVVAPASNSAPTSTGVQVVLPAPATV